MVMDDGAVGANIEKLLGTVLNDEDGVSLVLHIVQAGDGSNNEEAGDESQLKSCRVRESSMPRP